MKTFKCFILNTNGTESEINITTKSKHNLMRELVSFEFDTADIYDSNDNFLFQATFNEFGQIKIVD